MTPSCIVGSIVYNIILFLPIDQTVKAADITAILKTTGAWKAPGLDLLPTGFLKACKGPLARLLAQIVIVCL